MEEGNTMTHDVAPTLRRGVYSETGIEPRSLAVLAGGLRRRRSVNFVTLSTYELVCAVCQSRELASISDRGAYCEAEYVARRRDGGGRGHGTACAPSA